MRFAAWLNLQSADDFAHSPFMKRRQSSFAPSLGASVPLLLPLPLPLSLPAPLPPLSLCLLPDSLSAFSFLAALSSPSS